VWETPELNLFCEHSGVFSETWPTSGMTRGGMAYALPTWAPATDGTESSSSPALLGAPTSRDWKDGSPADVPTNGLLGRMVWDLA
jgi:hypothetical protein